MAVKRNASAAIVLSWFVCLPIAQPAMADDLSPSQQTALVKKYCAVCHSDAAHNGGLSLEHYDAARRDPALAAMLLSKLRNGAMGAAGIGVPDKDTQEAWTASTTAQSAGADHWTLTRGDGTRAHALVLTASIVRTAAPRRAGADAPLYRLTATCDAAAGQGRVQLTWSPDPQTDRTFLVSIDGGTPVAHVIEGREKMGNATPATSGRASVILDIPMPAQSLAVQDVFPGERIEFPIGALSQHARAELATCFDTTR